MAQQILSTNTFTTAKWIVSATASDGTHTTIAAALTSAASGDTIFIRPGTYTENITLKAGVNLCSFDCDAQSVNSGAAGNVVIKGKCSFSSAGRVSISGIQFQTNGDNAISVTGNSASILILTDCNLYGANTIVSWTSSSGSSHFLTYGCLFDLSTTGIKHFDIQGGVTDFYNTILLNSGGSSTANTISNATALNFHNCSQVINSITTSNTSGFVAFGTMFTGTLTINGTGTNTLDGFEIIAGSSSAISVGTGATLTATRGTVSSSNTNAITGLGTINIGLLTFSSTSSKVNTTTQVPQQTGPTSINASQPCFSAYMNTTQAGITGDGTQATVIFDSTDVNQGTGYSTSTGVFTAPVSGNYLFCTCLFFSGTSTLINTYNVTLAATSRNLAAQQGLSPANTVSGGFLNSMILKMAAGDTCAVKVTAVGAASKTLGILGNGANVQQFSMFSGCLLC